MLTKYHFVTKDPIDKGWSGDKKYRVTDEAGTAYLYRVSPAEQYDAKAHEFRMMEQVAALGVPMCDPLDFGKNEEGVWALQRFIEGRDAVDVIPSLLGTEQYAYGLESGRILRKIHSIPAPEGLPDWETHFNRKIDRKIRIYEECPLRFEGADAIIQYIHANRHLLANRPTCYQHGDYHIGNMMIDHEGQLTIIDFNRNDYGDPWEEFNRIVWCAQCSPLFASGMVNGYFEGEVPMDFWRLLALYMANNTLSSVPWAIPYGQTQIDIMLNQAQEVLTWFAGMTNPVPAWYTTPHKFTT